MCNHENAYVKKYEIGCGYYGYCPDCRKIGEYANHENEAIYNFECQYNVKIKPQITHHEGV